MEGELSRQSNEDNRKLTEDSYPKTVEGWILRKVWKEGWKKREERAVNSNYL